MYPRTRAWLLAAVVMLLAPASVLGQSLDLVNRPARSVPELLRDANEAHQEEDYRAFRDALVELHRRRPYNSDYMYQLVLAHAMLGDKRAAFNIMLQMQRQGLSYDFDQAPEAESLRDTQLYEYLNDLMVGAGQPVGLAEPVATLGESQKLPETIAWDAERERFLVGTVANGQIIAVRPDGETEVLLEASERNGLWAIHGLAVDAERNRLWASSAAHPRFSGFRPVDQGRSVLLEFRLDDLELLHRHPVPVDGRPHLLGKIALAPNGDVYVADALLPIIYLKRADADTLRPYFAAQNLVSLRGMAISDDGRRLYAADAEMGILVIDLEAGKPHELKVAETLNLGGIEGLEYWQNSLVIIQNGIRPQRVLKLELDPAGMAVTGIAPLAVALDILDAPSHGVAVDEDFYFFANSQWGSAEREARPVTIARTSLAGAPQIIDPEADRMFEQLEKARARGDVRSATPLGSKATPGVVQDADGDPDDDG